MKGEVRRFGGGGNSLANGGAANASPPLQPTDPGPPSPNASLLRAPAVETDFLLVKTPPAFRALNARSPVVGFPSLPSFPLQSHPHAALSLAARRILTVCAQDLRANERERETRVQCAKSDCAANFVSERGGREGKGAPLWVAAAVGSLAS